MIEHQERSDYFMNFFKRIGKKREEPARQSNIEGNRAIERERNDFSALRIDDGQTLCLDCGGSGRVGTSMSMTTGKSSTAYAADAPGPGELRLAWLIILPILTNPLR